MDSAGPVWRGGGGGAGGGTSGAASGADGIRYWEGGSSGQGAFGEQSYEPPSHHRSSNPTGSTWDPGAAGYGGSLNTSAATGSSGSEPPFKKIRSADQSAFGSHPGSGEAPPGSGYGGSGSTGAIAPPGVSNAQSYVASFGQGYGVSNESHPNSGAQNHGAVGEQSYGAAVAQGYGQSDVQTYPTVYGYQQLPSYGAESAPPNYASQQVHQQNAPVFQQSPQQSGYGGTLGVVRGKDLSNLFYKTKLCTKFKTGACTFNENCSFAHGVEELRKPPPGWEQMVNAMGGAAPGGRVAGTNPAMGQSGQRLFKTRLCRFYVEGNCPYGDRCNFLHGNQEEQKIPGMDNAGAGSRPSFKTRPCASWEKGEQCDFREKCHFAHGFTELQSFGAGGAPHTGVVLDGAPTDVTQHLNLKPELAVSSVHADQNISTSFPAPVTFGTEQGRGGSISATNLNAYQNPGTATHSFPNSQADTNGTTTNYGYWDQDKKWEGASNGVRPPAACPQTYTQSSQGYTQYNQTGSWITEYSGDHAYSRGEADAGASKYPSQQPQQQQNVSFFRGGSVPDYGVQKQDLSSPYGQDAIQNDYQRTTRNGETSISVHLRCNRSPRRVSKDCTSFLSCSDKVVQYSLGKLFSVRFASSAESTFALVVVK